VTSLFSARTGRLKISAKEVTSPHDTRYGWHGRNDVIRIPWQKTEGAAGLVPSPFSETVCDDAPGFPRKVGALSRLSQMK
jgi:hypothetical protein